MVRLLSTLLWLASIGSLAQAGGVTTTTTTTTSTTSTSIVPITFTDPSFFVERIWTGAALGVPADLGGIAFAPDGATLYVVGRSGQATSALFSLGVVRDGTNEVTDLTGPVTQVFAGIGTGLDSGLAHGPGGTFFYGYFPANLLAERPGGVAGAETTFSMATQQTNGTGGVVFNPNRVDGGTGFPKLIVNDGLARLVEVNLSPLGGGLYQPGAATAYVRVEAPIGGLGNMVFLPAPYAGDLLYAAFGDGQLRRIVIDAATGVPISQATGLPTLGTTNPIDSVFASGFGAEEFSGPLGLAIDPLTNDLFVSTSQGTPSNTIFQVEGFSSVVTTSTTVTTVTSTTSTSMPSTTSTSLPSTTSTSVTSTTSTSLPSTTSTSVTSTTSTSLPSTTSTSVTSTTSTSLPSTTSTTVTSTTTTSLLPTTTSTSSTVTSSTTLPTTTTSSSTVTTTSSTSTSTIPPPEACGNCLDDDGDGLTDFEDADCCAAPPAALVVEQLQLRTKDGASRLKLTASSLPAVSSLSPPTRVVFLQLAPGTDEPVLCATVDPVHFHGKRDRATFGDRTGGVPTAAGVSAIRLSRLGTGSLRADVRGTRLAFAAPAPGPLRVAMALRSLVDPGSPTFCVVDTVELTAGKEGGLELP